MNLDELTIGQLKELNSLLGKQNPSHVIINQIDPHPFELGQPYIIRTVTMIQTGRLKAVYKNELVLEEASWVADTGRFSEFVEDMDKVNEMEPIKGDFIVGRGGIIDAVKVVKLIRKLK